MRVLFFLSVFFAFFETSFASGAPLEMSGVWQASSEVQTVFRSDIINQRVYSQKDKQQLEKLRQTGFACTAVTSVNFRCVKNSFDSWEIPVEHKNQLLRKYLPLGFEVVRLPGEPQLLTEGDSTRQWQLPVLIYNQVGKTHEVIYWEMTTTNKLQFAIEKEMHWPHFLDNKQIFFRDQVLESKKNHQIKYHYDVVFIKQ